MLQDPDFHQQIEEAIRLAEGRTSAELVVVLAASSGSYRDTDLLAGAALALLSLGTMIWAPFPIAELLALSNSVLAFMVGTLACRFSPMLRRLLTTQKRRLAQVSLSAEAAFRQEGVGATRERNGLLLYFSLLERNVEILPDVGVEGRVEPAEWHKIRHKLLSEKGLSSFKVGVIPALTACGETLSSVFPPAPQNPDEIPNRPRIRP